MQELPPTTTTTEDAATRSLLDLAARLGDLARDLQESESSLISKTWNEEQALRQRSVALESDLKKLQAEFYLAIQRGAIDPKNAEKLDDELYRARYFIKEGDVASLLPNKDHGKFLKMFLGPVNLRATRKEVRFKMKEEYNNYRAWLLFLYTSLGLRENILRVNGSDIRPWWIYHHYCAMLMALVSLTWEIKGQPGCANKQKGVELFLVWAVMQGFAMLLQNRYQRQRLYTRIALGKARRMDVVWGETAGVEGQLLLLCPILFTLQGFEAYVGILLLKTALGGVVSEWQVIASGILLVLVAAGNFANTVQTLVSKSRFKAKMKRHKNKHDLDHSLSPPVMG